MHEKPDAVTITTSNGWKITARAVNPLVPSGLARVAWRQQGWDVSVTMRRPSRRENFNRCGSLLWRDNGCGWSLSSTEFWVSANTVFGECDPVTREKVGGGWSYKTDQFALKHLVEHIRRNVEYGPTPLKREYA